MGVTDQIGFAAASFSSELTYRSCVELPEDTPGVWAAVAGDEHISFLGSTTRGEMGS